MLLPLQPAGLPQCRWPKYSFAGVEPTPNIAIFQALFCPATLWTEPCHTPATTTRGRPARSSLTASFSTRNPPSRRRPATAEAWDAPISTRIRPPGAKQLGRSGRDAPIGIEPVGTAVQGKIRVVKGHFRRERADFAASDVRRVGDDQVEFALDRLAPVRDDERGAIGDAETLRIRFGKTKRRPAEIGAKAARLRQLGEKASGGCTPSPCRDRAGEAALRACPSCR